VRSRKHVEDADAKLGPLERRVLVEDGLVLLLLALLLLLHDLGVALVPPLLGWLGLHGREDAETDEGAEADRADEVEEDDERALGHERADVRAQVGPQPLRGHDGRRHLDLDLLALITVQEDALAAPEAAVHPRDAIGEQERNG
jgi:hypothetical protein